MESLKVYQVLARELNRLAHCLAASTPMKEAAADADARIERIMATAPSGSGIDNGIKLLRGKCFGTLKFQADFHHMNEHGFYDGWTEHVVTVKPCLSFGIDISISGKDRNDIKDSLHQTFTHWLQSEWLDTTNSAVPSSLKIES